MYVLEPLLSFGIGKKAEGGREGGKQAGRQAEMDVVQFTESSVGLQVPSVIGAVKDEPRSGSWSSDDHQRRGGDSSSSSRIKVELDKDFLCPICIQTMKDAFLTSCGHSFCYMCIMTHLGNRSNCPCCGLYLTNNKLFPNFLLNKVSLSFFEGEQLL